MKLLKERIIIIRQTIKQLQIKNYHLNIRNLRIQIQNQIQMIVEAVAAVVAVVIVVVVEVRIAAVVSAATEVHQNSITIQKERNL